MTDEELKQWRTSIVAGDKVWVYQQLNKEDYYKGMGPVCRQVYAIHPKTLRDRDISLELWSDRSCWLSDAYPGLEECLLGEYERVARDAYYTYEQGMRALAEHHRFRTEIKRLKESCFEDWQEFHKTLQPGYREK